jgi:ketosteroid isomerase-like protein
MLRPSFPQFRATVLTTQFNILVLLLLLVLGMACQTQTAADTHAADEAALKNLDSEWSKAAGAKDVDKTVSYYAAAAVVMPPNIPSLTTKEAIRGLWQSMLTSPGFSGGWNATRVEVARSGELGYVSGTYEFTERDTGGQPMTDKGKYLEVWKKQTDGSWKCVIDMFSSDLPLAAPAADRKESGSK